MVDYKVIKRIMDLVFALIALIILLPIFVVIALIIKIDSKGPVFFRQERMGKDNQAFHILKFRTMRTDTPKDLPTFMLQKPEVFITKVGKVLRKTSLDELPQLINIVKGEMSFIGPRPVITNETDLITLRVKYGANKALPGVTGLAQINGRDELIGDEKAQFDGRYVKTMSFKGDLKIFLKTVIYVLASKGVVEGARGKVAKVSNEPATEKKTGIR